MTSKGATRLTAKQRAALTMIREHGIHYVGDPNVYAPVIGAGTVCESGNVWLNLRTADALERRGYGQVVGYGEDCEFTLWPEQREARSFA